MRPQLMAAADVVQTGVEQPPGIRGEVRLRAGSVHGAIQDLSAGEVEHREVTAVRGRVGTDEPVLPRGEGDADDASMIREDRLLLRGRRLGGSRSRADPAVDVELVQSRQRDAPLGGTFDVPPAVVEDGDRRGCPGAPRERLAGEDGAEALEARCAASGVGVLRFRVGDGAGVERVAQPAVTGHDALAVHSALPRSSWGVRGVGSARGAGGPRLPGRRDVPGCGESFQSHGSAFVS